MHLVLQQRSVLGEGVVAQARLQLQRNEHLSKDGAVHQARPTPADLQRGLVCHVEVEAVLTNGLQIRVVLCHSIHGVVGGHLMGVVEGPIRCVGHVLSHAPVWSCVANRALVSLGIVVVEVYAVLVVHVVVHRHAHLVRLRVLQGPQRLLCNVRLYTEQREANVVVHPCHLVLCGHEIHLNSSSHGALSSQQQPPQACHP
mmetsp:Transcript_1841/g.6569  ORF Transcript_1841/g.6569 Transcript_1841/m.6569 type:complete len:200 (-) Transcript_1841:2039-2638(-)